MSTEGLLLEPDEKILLQRQRHWISLLPVWLTAVGLVLGLLLLSYFFTRVVPSTGIAVPAGLIALLSLVILVIAALVIVIGLWVWRQNHLVVTNLHVFQVNQGGLFNRSVSQLSLAKVQDVTHRQNGLLATICGFGDVEVETAGEEENFIFRQVAGPEQLCQSIMQAHEALASGSPRVDL
jgi:uncharacterized membrane protein YdbT with pleckstrin-like domain